MRTMLIVFLLLLAGPADASTWRIWCWAASVGERALTDPMESGSECRDLLTSTQAINRAACQGGNANACDLVKLACGCRMEP